MRVSSGKANLNYRKIDLKKKSYSKGKGAGKFMKKFEYKNKLAMKVHSLFRALLFCRVIVLTNKMNNE